MTDYIERGHRNVGYYRKLHLKTAVYAENDGKWWQKLDIIRDSILMK